MRAVLVSLTLLTAFAQAQPPAKLEFEVATIKAAAPLTGRGVPRNGPGSPDPGHINYTSLSMKNLLMTAYDLPVNQVSGPAWIDTERYDIVANVPPGATKEQVNVMLQNLLADRFKLKVTRETREVALFELVVAKGGSKLKPYVEDPDAPKIDPAKGFATDKNGNPVPRPGGLMFTMGAGPRTLTASKQPMARVATILAAEVKRPVVDKTGLTGEFDFTLKFHSEDPGPPGQVAPPPQDSDAADIFVAVQEQLGLRLESKKGPIEVVVVEQGEKTPTGN